MPLIYVTSPRGTFADAARDALAEELTVIALNAEKLPTTAFDKSTTWIYFYETPASHVYHGGESGGTRVVSVEVNCFEGGLTDDAKRELYERFTATISTHAGFPATGRAPVYILVREMDPVNWGVFGGRTSIDELRIAHPDEAPI